jgi:type 1 glutamine amidotransferase
MSHAARTSVLIALPAALILAAAILPGEEAKKPRRILLVTGADVPAHDWRATTPVTRAILEEGKDFQVFVSEEPSVLETSALAGYDAIVLNYRNPPTAPLGEAARKNLAAFVAEGKGLVAVHFAVAAWSDWAEYAKIVGRVWVGKGPSGEKASGHGPRGTFKAKVVAKKSPITEGLEDFEADDELYARLSGDAPIDVLVSAQSDWSGAEEPLAWTLRYGKGRVFVTVLGHDVKARESQAFRKLLARGTAWAASAGAGR